MKTIRKWLSPVTVLFIGSNFAARAQMEVLSTTTGVWDSAVQIAADRGVSRWKPTCRQRALLGENAGALLAYPMPFFSGDSTTRRSSTRSAARGSIWLTPPLRLATADLAQAQRGITVSNLVEQQGKYVLDLIDQVRRAV